MPFQVFVCFVMSIINCLVMQWLEYLQSIQAAVRFPEEEEFQKVKKIIAIAIAIASNL